MTMTLEEYRRRFPDRPEPIPLEYQGKWIAWAEDHQTIIASGDNLSQVRKLTEELGHSDPVFQFVASYPYLGAQTPRLRPRSG